MIDVDFRLNAIVDGSFADTADLATLARLAAENGATIIQYRDKTATTREMVARGIAIKHALAASGVPLLINDRIDVALAVEADGVHLGRDDMAAETARSLLGTGAIIGLTVKSVADADVAIAAPINYACIGGVFETLSKMNPEPPLGIEGFAKLRSRIREHRPNMPVGAIAGLDAARARQVIRAGASGVAVISAIFGAANIPDATTALRGAVDEALAEGEK